MIPSSPGCRRVLASLKDFQRRTVDHVFTKMYLDDPPAQRFLIADEVGLGKTLVARGLVARVLDHLAGKVDRTDVIYVCSNAAIAQQNLNRLTPSGQRCTSFATRLTLLPTQLERIRENPVNFISFTPATTFDLKSQGGIAEERALIYRMLAGNLHLHGRGLGRALQGGCSRSSWDRWLKHWSAHIDYDLAADFLAEVAADARLIADLARVCDEFADGRRRVSPETRQLAWDAIGRLRHTLAYVCIGSLEPDLVILDEFQRFRHLLEGESDAALLARSLMDYTSREGLEARVLLLSATPYRMFTLATDANDDHYRDLLRTFRFLCRNDDRADKLEKDLSRFRGALCGLSADDTADIDRVRRSIRRTLSTVMVRTERAPNSDARNAMLEELRVLSSVETDDLRDARDLQRVATASGAGDTVEYWKSAPYLLNFMREYELPVKLRRAKPRECELPLQRLAERALTAEALEAYRPVEARNARLRLLMRDTLDEGHWRALWVPPSLPYTEPQEPYTVDAPATKTLVFSSWNVVPDAISMICSYEAERRMLEGADVPSYSELTKKKKALLRFAVEADGRPSGMTALALEYPSPVLGRIGDPLKVALDVGQGAPVPADLLLEHARLAVERELRRAGIGRRAAEGPVDQRWYWAAAPLLDCRQVPGFRDWFLRWGPWDGASLGHDPEDDSESGFRQHVESLREVVRDPTQLGRVPDDLVETLALLSVASPACCALRSLVRVTGESYRGFMSTQTGAELMSSAAVAARGFRTLFNLSETIALLRGGEAGVPYWRMVLAHNLQGNLQALLDEYFHIQRELMGMIDRPAGEVAAGISEAALSALSLRPSTLRFSEIPRRLGDDWPSFSVRCRYAMRFADIRDDQGNAVVRATAVRDAFNSPFRPFILSSTSIGQEGLDFHPYCHKVYHWNLPSNPVDMEQREGRVSRYKGHAVRKNLALALGLRQLAESSNGGKDPWETLFQAATKQRPGGTNDLVPFWIYETENGSRIERHVPILECSREIARYERLKKALAIYRLVFGQPRQQDLLELLQAQNLPKTLVDSMCISLAP